MGGSTEGELTNNSGGGTRPFMILLALLTMLGGGSTAFIPLSARVEQVEIAQAALEANVVRTGDLNDRFASITQGSTMRHDVQGEKMQSLEDQIRHNDAELAKRLEVIESWIRNEGRILFERTAIIQAREALK